MRTTFSGISIALRGLQAQQISLDVTGHNVANVNNSSYSRQSAIHSATKPYPSPMMGYTPSNGQLGTGVQVSQINRMRDSFIDYRLRNQLTNLNYWDTLRDGLSQVELFFNEPSDNGIHNALDQFWDSLQDLSREPDFSSVREVVVQRAQVLVESIGNTRGQLQTLRENLNTNIPIKVNEINVLAARLADVNVQIGKISATGSLPNDLLDTRDDLLEELSKLVDIEVVQDHVNMVGVTVGGASLVHRGTAYTMATSGVANEEQGYKKNEIFWAATNSPVQINSGEIAGLIRLRDEEIQKSIDDLDAWTLEFAQAFNDLHAKGYDLDGNGSTSEPIRFFTFIKPSSNPADPNPDTDPPYADVKFAGLNILVNHEIAANVNLIRASTEAGGVEGNGLNAIALAGLRANPPTGSTITIGEAYNSIISGLGVRSQKAIKMVESEETLANHLYNLRDSVSGVQLDEEMANMIRFQHAYGAAARMMTAVDEALDTIINRLGIVGR